MQTAAVVYMACCVRTHAPIDSIMMVQNVFAGMSLKMANQLLVVHLWFRSKASELLLQQQGRSAQRGGPALLHTCQRNLSGCCVSRLPGVDISLFSRSQSMYDSFN